MSHISKRSGILDRLPKVEYGQQSKLEVPPDLLETASATEKCIIKKFDEMVRGFYDQRHQKEFSVTLSFGDMKLAKIFADKIRKDGHSDIRTENSKVCSHMEFAPARTIRFDNTHYEENLDEQVRCLADTVRIALNASEPVEISLAGRSPDFREKLQKVLIDMRLPNMTSVDIIEDTMKISFSDSELAISERAEEIFRLSENWIQGGVHLDEKISIPVSFVQKEEVAVGTGEITVSGSMSKEVLEALKKRFEPKYGKVSIYRRGENRCTIHLENPYL